MKLLAVPRSLPDQVQRHSGAKRPERVRVRLIGASGAAIIVLSAGAALLPALGNGAGTSAIGILLVIAGLIEALAGFWRSKTRTLAMLPGLATAAAGSIFLGSDGRLIPSVTVVTAWLLLRSAILLLESRLAHGSSRTWLGVSAFTDFVLGSILLIGLSVSAVVVMIFGSTPQLVAAFAWVLAISFIATGTLLLQISYCEQLGGKASRSLSKSSIRRARRLSQRECSCGDRVSYWQGPSAGNCSHVDRLGA